MLSTDKILSAFWKKLFADATIKGADYLNGTTKLIKGPTRPKESSNPQLTLTFDGSVDKVSTFIWGYVQFTVFCDANANGTANTALMGKILKRGTDLLQAKVGSDWSESGVRIFHSFVATPATGPFDNPDRKGEFFMATRIYVNAIEVP